MFLQSGGGGKGIRPSQQQNQHSHQQTTHHHHHHQTHNAHAQQQQQQQQHQQQQQQQLQQQQQQAAQIQHHTVYIPTQQPSANHSHLPLSHVSHHQQQIQQQQVHQQQVHHQQQLHQQQQISQQQQQSSQAQNQLQQQPLIYYGNPPPHTAQYVTSAQPPPCTNVGQHQTTVHLAATSPPVQVSSSSSLVSTNGNNGGVLTTSGSNTSIIRPISNSALQHYTTAPSGLIAAQPQGSGPGTTYMTTAYLNYNPAAVLTAAAQAAVAFNANTNGGGPTGAPTATYYSTAQTASIQQQKSITQQQALHHTTQPTPIAFYHTPNAVQPANQNSSNHRQQQQIRNVVTSQQPPQQNQRQNAGPPQPTFIAYIPQGQPPQRATLVSNNGQILAPRSGAISGHATYIPSPFCPQPMPMNASGGMAAPPPQSHMLAPAGLAPGQSGIQTYATHLPPGSMAVNSTLSATSLSSGSTSLGGEKVRERKHAIPIIHPITHENILESKSLNSAMKQASNTRQMAPAAILGSSDGGPATTTSSVYTFKPPEGEKTFKTEQFQPQPSLCLLMSPNSKIDQQMQTEKQIAAEKAAKPIALLTEKLSYTEISERSSNLSVTSGTAAGEDEITIIVKDIIANSEERLSFLSPQRSWKYKDEKKSTEISQQQVTAAVHVDSKKSHHNDNPPPTQQQRPKSANKQNTATPISIANAAAEAATGSVATLSAKSFPPQNPTAKTVLNTKAITPSGIEPISQSQAVINLHLQQNPLPQRQQRHQTPPSTTRIIEKPRQASLTSGASSSTASTPTHQQRRNMGGRGSTTNANINVNSNISNNNHNHNTNTNSSSNVLNNPVNGGGGGVGSNSGLNLKKRGKALKRAKEIQKKQRNMTISTNKNLINTQHNNNNNNNNAVAPSSSTVRMAAEASAEPSNQTDSNITNKRSISSNNISHNSTTTTATKTHSQAANAAAPLQRHQANLGQQKSCNVNNIISNKKSIAAVAGRGGAQATFIKGDSTATDDTLSTSTSGSSITTFQTDTKHHVPTEEIVAKFLHTSTPQNSAATNNSNSNNGSSNICGNDNHKQSDIQQLQFLNSSSSACEDDDILKTLSSSASSSKHRLTGESSTSITQLKFGDFSEEHNNNSNEQTMISSSTWTSSLSTSTTSTASSVTTMSTKSTKELKTITEKIENNDHAVAVVPPTTTTTATVTKSTTSVGGRSQSGASSKTIKRTLSTTSNKSGRIKYSIEELKEMSKLAESRKPPMVPCQKGDCIAQLFVSRQQHHHSHNQGALGGLHQHLQQQYQHMNFNESMDFVSGKRRGQGKKHQHDQQMCGNSSSGGRNNDQRGLDIIRVHLSLKEEIKLSECENAWQPETLRRSVQVNADTDDDLEGVLKKVRGILNKLTPDNFDVLLKTMSSISMNTYEKMQQVMLLIFEKTVSEPNFAPTYAKLCKVLFHEIKAENKSLFTSSLITRIQHEFESYVNDANAKALKLQPLVEKLESCSDANKRAEVQAELEDQEYQFRRRAWGTVRFIGELYKLQSLTSDRVLICIESLLEHGCEEKLEYMCKLLTTVGHLIEGTSPEQYSNNIRIDKIFRKIQDFVHKSRSMGHKPASIKISSRVRFMMQDVMDLRARNWDQPTSPTVVSGFTNRQRTMNANTAKHEEKSHYRMGQNSGGSGGMGGSGSNSGGNQHHQQRHIVPSRHSDTHNNDNSSYYLQKLQKSHQQDHQTVSVDYTKLRFSTVEETTQGTPKLGNPSNYIWRNLSNRPVTSTPPGMSMIKRSSAGHNTSNHPNMSYGSSMPSTSSSTGGKNQSQNNSSSSNASSAETVLESFTTKECQQMLNRLIEEALNSRDWEHEVINIWETCNIKQQIAVFHYLLMDYLHLCTIKRQQRLAISNIFIHLMRQKAFDKATFTQVYARFADEFPDLLVDVPNGWTYVFEFIGPMMHKRLLHFNDVWQRKWLNDMYFTERFIKSFLNYFTTEFGAKYSRELWHKEYKLDRGQIFWSDNAKFRDFIISNGFGFIEQNLKQQQHHHHHQQFRLHSNGSHSTIEQVDRIKYLLSITNDDCDMAIDYITTNVNINTNFIRQLTKFLCCDYALTVMNTNNNNKSATSLHGGRTATGAAAAAASKQQLNVQLFRRKCIPLLRLCIDARESHEIACLDEIVIAMQHHFFMEYEDEGSANDVICNVFNVLYDCEVIPKESYEKWYRTEMENTPVVGAGSLLSSSSSASSVAGGGGAAAAASTVHRRNLLRLLSVELSAFMDKLL